MSLPSYVYDEVLYESHPIPGASPSHLETMARLFGLKPTAAREARVLEIGCATAVNLCGLAAAFPKSKFVGIDLSARQISIGNAQIEQMGLSNLELRHMSILDLDQALGTFDYILCHGIYSWVPENVRRKILEFCGIGLNEHGLAYISFNSYPGWHQRDIIRDIMEYGARKELEPLKRVRAGRKLAHFVSQSIQPLSNYDSHFKSELTAAIRFPDWYILHDYMSEENTPFYISEFIQDASQVGLAYLGDCELPRMATFDLRAEEVQVLRKLAAGSQQKEEQYLDFLRNRMFRRTVLVRDSAPVQRPLRPENLAQFSFISHLQVSAESKAESADEFVVKGGGRLKVSDQASRLALHSLAARFPLETSYSELLHEVEKEITLKPNELRELCSTLLRGILAGFIEAHASSPAFETKVSKKPKATTKARHDAIKGPLVTNIRSEQVELNEFERKLLELLDGSRTVRKLIIDISKSAAILPSKIDGEKKSAKKIQEEAGEAVRSALQKFIESALLHRGD